VACNCKPSVFHNVGPTANCPATSDKHYNVNSMAAARDLECNAPSVTSRCLRATASLTQSHGIVADSASNFARTHLSSAAQSRRLITLRSPHSDTIEEKCRRSARRMAVLMTSESVSLPTYNPRELFRLNW